ncbi:MAG: DUF4430 domain-containing protein [Acutalibacteraceae bacterium]
MKKTFKKTVSVFLTCLMIFACLSASVFAADSTITVKLRIEGINKCFYYNDVEVQSGATALDVIEKADSLDDTLTVTTVESQYGSYISEINGEKEKTFKGWDGWLFRVNDVEPEVGISAYTVADKDSIVVYYGDPYGVGMQYPVADTSKLSDGQISFTSMDTVYDEDWNATVKEMPVTDYRLIWGYGDGQTIIITPDENGVCSIDKQYLTDGAHSVQIEKTASNGCPLVLRFAPDYTVNNANESANGIVGFFAKIIKIIKTWIETIVNLVKSLTSEK